MKLKETEQITQNYSRQAGFFDPEEQKFNLHIFGAGSIGSFATLNLAKLGFSDISVYDFDKVEIHNLPNQFFRNQDVNKFKVEALKDIVSCFSATEIKANNIKLTKENSADILSNIDLSSIIILAFDNLEARRLIFEQFKGYPNILIDCRMGGLGYSIQVLRLDNEEECKLYEESLNKPTLDLPCGQQSIIFTLLSIASELSNIIVKIHNDLPYPSLIKREMSSYMFISNIKGVDT